MLSKFAFSLNQARRKIIMDETSSPKDSDMQDVCAGDASREEIPERQAESKPLMSKEDKRRISMLLAGKNDSDAKGKRRIQLEKEASTIMGDVKDLIRQRDPFVADSGTDEIHRDNLISNILQIYFPSAYIEAVQPIVDYLLTVKQASLKTIKQTVLGELNKFGDDNFFLQYMSILISNGFIQVLCNWTKDGMLTKFAVNIDAIYGVLFRGEWMKAIESFYGEIAANILQRVFCERSNLFDICAALQNEGESDPVLPVAEILVKSKLIVPAFAPANSDEEIFDVEALYLKLFVPNPDKLNLMTVMWMYQDSVDFAFDNIHEEEKEFFQAFFHKILTKKKKDLFKAEKDTTRLFLEIAITENSKKQEVYPTNFWKKQAGVTFFCQETDQPEFRISKIITNCTKRMIGQHISNQLDESCNIVWMHMFRLSTDVNNFQRSKPNARYFSLTELLREVPLGTHLLDKTLKCLSYDQYVKVVPDPVRGYRYSTQAPSRTFYYIDMMESFKKFKYHVIKTLSWSIEAKCSLLEEQLEGKLLELSANGATRKEMKNQRLEYIGTGDFLANFLPQMARTVRKLIVAMCFSSMISGKIDREIAYEAACESLYIKQLDRPIK